MLKLRGKIMLTRQHSTYWKGELSLAVYIECKRILREKFQAQRKKLTFQFIIVKKERKSICEAIWKRDLQA